MDEMQGAEDEGEGSVLVYVTKPEFRKQRSRSPFCNIHSSMRMALRAIFCIYKKLIFNTI